jgi:tetratricopeptide (TPR) repeat protein
METARTAIEQNPAAAWPCILLGIAYFLNGNRAEFVKSLEATVEKLSDPLPISVVKILVSYLKSGKHEALITTLNMNIDKDPTDRWAWRELAEMYAFKGDHHAVIQTFKRALHQNESEWWPRAALGDSYLKTRDYADAIATYEEASFKFANVEAIWKGLAMCYNQKSDQSGVLKTFQRAVRENPTQKWSWDELYSAYITTGHGGIKTFNELEEALQNKGNHKAIIETFENAVIRDANLTIDDLETAGDTLRTVIER